MTPPDVVYPLRAAGGYEELRYSLRSLCNLPHGRVWLVGGCPPWAVNVQHIATVQDGDKIANTYGNLFAAAANATISDPFYVFNDDFFITAPLDSLPIWHLGRFADFADAYQRRRDPYAQRVRATLTVVGPDALAYEGHWPILVRKQPLIDVLVDCLDHDPPLQWRTIYGNRLRLGGRQRRDCKVKHHGDVRVPVVSTGDDSFKRLRVGRQLRAIFTRPSRYERTPDG